MRSGAKLTFYILIQDDYFIIRVFFHQIYISNLTKDYSCRWVEPDDHPNGLGCCSEQLYRVIIWVAIDFLLAQTVNLSTLLWPFFIIKVFPPTKLPLWFLLQNLQTVDCENYSRTAVSQILLTQCYSKTHIFSHSDVSLKLSLHTTLLIGWLPRKMAWMNIKHEWCMNMNGITSKIVGEGPGFVIIKLLTIKESIFF